MKSASELNLLVSQQGSEVARWLNELLDTLTTVSARTVSL